VKASELYGYTSLAYNSVAVPPRSKNTYRNAVSQKQPLTCCSIDWKCLKMDAPPQCACSQITLRIWWAVLFCVGVGVGYCVLNSLVCIYYNVIIALALLYLFTSLRSSLPWASCENDWNTPTCGDPIWFNTSG